METKPASLAPRWLKVLLAILFVVSLGWFINANYRANDMPLSEQWWMLVESTLILAVPLGLLYLAFGLLVAAYRQKQRDGLISGTVERWVYRTPRIAGVLISIFVGLFALDVFSMPGTVGEKILAFLVHAAPAILMGVAVALAWRWDWIGVMVFFIMALVFLRFVVFNIGGDWLAMLLLFNFPMLLIGMLFWASWRWRSRPAQT